MHVSPAAMVPSGVRILRGANYKGFMKLKTKFRIASRIGWVAAVYGGYLLASVDWKILMGVALGVGGAALYFYIGDLWKE
jgi:hypothetical protein